MLYLDEVVIHNFKSLSMQLYASTRGFNCIVGLTVLASPTSAILFSLLWERCPSRG